MTKHIANRRHDHEGFVLVSVLWILAILTVISIGFASRAALERRMAWYALDHEEAQQMARAAAQRGILELQNKMVLDGYNNQVGYTGLDQRWAYPIDLLTEASYFGARPKDAGDVCEVRIEDTSGRIAINTVPKEFFEALKSVKQETVSRLLKLREMSTPYHQQALLHSVEELRSMQDFSDKEWWGIPGQFGLADLFTVWGESGPPWLNLNTAPVEVLRCLPGMDPAVAASVVAYRNGPDGRSFTADDLAFINNKEPIQKLNISGEKLSPLFIFCKVNSQYFTIHAHASRRRGKINAYCTVTVGMRGSNPVILAWREGAGGA